MKDNRLHEGLYLFTYTIILLSLLAIVPAITIGSFQLKEINLISDIKRIIEPPVTRIDSAIAVEPEVTRKNSKCPAGLVCFEDYSENGKALQAFVKKMGRRKSEPVRIAFFGDSFIEGDILTAPLRDTLQQIFGGRGQGFVPLYSDVSKFRNSIKHEFENLEQKTITGKYFSEPEFGPSGQIIRALENNQVFFGPGKNQKRLEKASLLYACQNPGSIRLTVNDTIEKELTFQSDPLLGKLPLTETGTASIRLNFNAADSANLYGLILESGNGVYIDNLAMRGNSGLALTRLSGKMLSKIRSIRPYHLIVLQFGLNVISEQDSTDYSWYVAGMRNVVDHFRNAFPESSILILGISDRSMNLNGEFQTMPAVMRMRKAQRRIAEKTGVLFWDTFDAMGGENSMVRLAALQPPLAGKDHTHLNYRGGQMVAGKLAKAMIFEIEQYESTGANY